MTQLFLNWDIFEVTALLISITALFSYVNYRWLKLPQTIGVMVLALFTSLVFVILGHVGFDGITKAARLILNHIHFDQTLMKGMLSFLLFAGALHIDINDLLARKLTISFLATFGLLLSTFLFATGIFFLFKLFGVYVPYIYCLLFGAVISPTDPIAVMGILKNAGISKNLRTTIAGESLFNDGIAVVVFTVLYGIAVHSHPVSFFHISYLFLLEAVGGAVLGLLLGWGTYLLLKSIDNYDVEILLTLALVMGGYALASALHTSGPIAIVAAGLLIGNKGRRLAMSESVRRHLDTFWEMMDEILNAVLFVMIGLEALVLSFSGNLPWIGLAAIPVILLSRLISVALPVSILKRWRSFAPGIIKIMTWGGLRGGISIALALSLPPERNAKSCSPSPTSSSLFPLFARGSPLKNWQSKRRPHGAGQSGTVNKTKKEVEHDYRKTVGERAGCPVAAPIGRNIGKK